MGVEEPLFLQMLLAGKSLAELQETFPHEPLGEPLVRALGHEKTREHAKSLIMELPLEQVALKLVLALEKDALFKHAEECILKRAERSKAEDPNKVELNAILGLLALKERNGDLLGEGIHKVREKLNGENIPAPALGELLDNLPGDRERRERELIAFGKKPEAQKLAQQKPIKQVNATRRNIR